MQAIARKQVKRQGFPKRTGLDGIQDTELNRVIVIMFKDFQKARNRLSEGTETEDRDKLIEARENTQPRAERNKDIKSGPENRIW